MILERRVGVRWLDERVELVDIRVALLRFLLLVVLAAVIVVLLADDARLALWDLERKVQKGARKRLGRGGDLARAGTNEEANE